LIIAGGLFVAQFWFSDRIAAFSMGAREVTPEEAPELHGAVDRLCALADMPKPRVAIANSDVPNAFATGRNQKNAMVCATTGLLSRYRELSADRAAAILTGRPSALASALTKVTGQMARIPTEDLRKVEPFNAFFFAPAFNQETASRLLSSHPTLEQRLDQLGRI